MDRERSKNKSKIVTSKASPDILSGDAFNERGIEFIDQLCYSISNILEVGAFHGNLDSGGCCGQPASVDWSSPCDADENPLR